VTIKNNKHDNNDNKPRENIFEIMDGIIVQLNRTKKMFIIMILTIVIIPPIAFAVTFVLLGPPLYFDFGSRESTPHIFGPPPQIAVARTIPILISLVWLGIGIRQWFVLSKWSKKYERYKELQRKVDEKLDYDNDDKGKKVKQNNKKYYLW
jgi:hypothetical protein